MFRQAGDFYRSSGLRRLISTSLKNVIGISQRDPNYYPFLNETDMEHRIVEAIKNLWEEKVKGKWESTQGNCKLLSPTTTGLLIKI